MRTIKYLPLIAALISVCSGVALGKGWRGIEPLHSTRSDVEKLLGPNPGSTYDLENEAVYFEYQTPERECGKKLGSWNVPLNTVLGIIVASKEKKSIVEFNLDRTYVKSKVRPYSHYDYYSEDDGITYSVSGDIVYQITYTQALKDRRLACLRREENKPGNQR
jgi:hypothetical protein